MSDFHDDPDRLSYPEADRLVEQYVQAKVPQRARATSRAVLEWADVPDTAHNQRRVYDALECCCEPLDDNWAGRTVFRLPDDDTRQ